MAAASHARQNHPVAGIALMLSGVILGTCMDAALKFTVATAPALQVTALRALFILVFAAPLVVRAGGWRVLRTSRPLPHALRAGAAVGGTVCFLNALGRLPLATTIAIGMSAP